MIKCQNYIAGEWVFAEGDGPIQSINPATGDIVGTAPSASIDDVEICVKAARKAFETSTWAEDSQLRTRVLNKFAQEIWKRQDELGQLLTDENGKIINDARYEVDRGAGVVEYYAGLAQNVFGHTATAVPDFHSFVMRQPLGVVGLVVPFNFPVVLLLRSMAPALAAGNAVIIKPACSTPCITYEIIKILTEIEGLPKGIVSLLSGSGSVVGAGLVKHPEIDMIALTGSSFTGKQVMKDAADNLTRVSLELGGKSPNIILDDADFDRAVKYALKGSWLTFSGQVCYSGTRVLVQDGIYDRFVEAIKEQTEQLKMGYGITPDIQMGPLIDEKQLGTVLEYIESGKQSARLITGGYRVTEGELGKGNFIAPTIFADVTKDCRIFKEEIFGPVLSICRFKDIDEAIELANATEFGLAGAVWTQDVTKAMSMAKRIKSGTVWINNYGLLPYQAEMGGMKQSGIGRQYGIEGLNEFTELKHIAIDLSPDR